MKDVLFSGSRFLTTDEVADALLRYARALAQYGRADIVSFPAVVDGMPATSWLTIGSGCGGPIAAVSVADSPIVGLEGATEACVEIARRSQALEGDWPEVGQPASP